MLRKHQLVDPILELVPYHLKNSSCRTEVPILLQLKTRKNRNSVIKKINWQFSFLQFRSQKHFSRVVSLCNYFGGTLVFSLVFGSKFVVPSFN
jgi:hypothetical protein